MAMYGAFGKRANFSPQEFYNLTPTDRFTAEIFELMRTVIFAPGPEEALIQIVLLESALKPLYTDVEKDTVSSKPYSAGYAEWRMKFRKKIKEENITNAYAIGAEMYEQLLMVMREAGLIGGDNVGLIAVIRDDNTPLSPDDIKPDNEI